MTRGWTPVPSIVPVKSFERGKSRLAPQLAPDARHAVSAALFRRVLQACTGCVAIDHVLVASDSARVVAPSARVSLLLDAAPRPAFAAVLDAALAHAYARGATRAIIIVIIAITITSAPRGPIIVVAIITVVIGHGIHHWRLG